MFSILRNRYARRSKNAYAFAALGLALLMVVSAVPQGMADGRYDSLDELWKHEGKGLDRGVVEIFSFDPSQPSGWVFILDSTLDGNGVEYELVTSSHPSSSAANPSLTMQFVFDLNASPLTLQEAIDHIVANYAHVSSATDLTITKRVVTLVP